MGGALEGIRVLDLVPLHRGSVLCADARRHGRRGDQGRASRRRGCPPPFPILQRGEHLHDDLQPQQARGITLNTRHPEAKGILEELIRASDVLVENYRPGTLAEMGFGYDRLRELNPRLVVTSISGFGQTGPFAKRALFDAIAQAMSGLMSLTGTGCEPTLTGTFIADYIAGLHGVIGTVLALHHRERSGEGQVVDVASLDAMFSCLSTYPPPRQCSARIRNGRGLAIR